jgi:tRNA modification GTPase
MSLATLSDTICALSTPLGTSALATLRLSGADAIRIAASCIDGKEKVFTTRGGDSFYTNVSNQSGERIDDVVVTIWRAPRSYTGEDIVEFHTHGSPVIVELLQKRLTSSGARLAEAGEFSRRAFANGKLGLEELERTLMRLDASSEESLTKVEKILSDKFDRLREIYGQIIALLAQVNAVIDFGESDEIEITGLEEQVASVTEKLIGLKSKAINEQLNKGYFSVALIGEPNVGKSSIFNQLLRYERSIVSEIPGTTRDYVEAFIMLGGFRVKLIDTAGLREVSDVIESRGISLGTTAAEKADIVLRVTGPETRTAQGLAGETILHNKSDIDNYSLDHSISAKTGEGISELISVLRGKISELDSSINW